MTSFGIIDHAAVPPGSFLYGSLVGEPLPTDRYLVGTACAGPIGRPVLCVHFTAATEEEATRIAVSLADSFETTIVRPTAAADPFIARLGERFELANDDGTYALDVIALEPTPGYVGPDFVLIVGSADPDLNYTAGVQVSRLTRKP